MHDTNDDGTAAVDRALNRLARMSRWYRATTRAILRAQAALQAALTEEQWAIYLQLDELVNDRDRRLLDMAIGLALRHGRRAARSRP